MPATRVKLAHESLAHSHKNRVGFHRKYDVDLCFVLQAVSKAARQTIGVLRIS